MKMCSKVDQTATLSPQDNYFPEVLENCKEICYNVENAKAKWRKPDEEVRIMAVTKTVPPEKVNFAVAQGFKLLGENRVQEFLSKKEAYDKSAEVQFIGHLQTNKVKYIAPYISMIESVDSLKLLKEIEKQAAKHDRVVKVLLELHLAEEDTKSGLSLDACRELLEAGEWREMKHVQICGIMMMASNTDDEQQIAQEFDEAARFFDEIKVRYFADDDAFCERSWGMSHDYHIAVKHGSTMVRVGTTIFGPRIY